MRKIEQAMIDAIQGRRSWHAGNTRVLGAGEIYDVFLHGNHIARFRPYNGNSLEITLAGWNTTTTRSRLNALANAFGSNGGNVYTRKGQPYIGERKVSCTEWVTV